MTVAAIAIAGAFGAVARYGVGQLVGGAGTNGFPWATFIINVSGSFAAGVLVVLFTSRFVSSEVLSAALLIGFLGAFTTFSTFSVQAQQLLEAGAAATVFAYVASSVVVGVGAAWLGVALGRSLSG